MGVYLLFLAEACRDSPSVWTNYRAGFNECASEVMHCMRNVYGVDPAVQIRMFSHLAECVERANATTAPPHAKMATPLRDMPTRHITSPLTSVPMATQESSLPGALTPPATPCAREFHNLSPGNTKGHFAIKRVDQVVPGSVSDLDLSCGNELMSFTDPTESSSKLSLYNSTDIHRSDIHRSLSPKLKMKCHVRAVEAVIGSSKKSVSVSRQPYSRNVWRPW